ncbi:hypothetical protein DEO72_LG10g327 [Vigna unguiculata]|uniref:Asd-4/GZF3-like helical region domain-containing protein n=1 Tax=Vigna unguiculata TaxID=3917 RepID=A0A4D6N764_VIGUN|nr:hypothetical protein DEO72_LG10g327 [Vigna unguiculata]
MSGGEPPILLPPPAFSIEAALGQAEQLIPALRHMEGLIPYVRQLLAEKEQLRQRVMELEMENNHIRPRVQELETENDHRQHDLDNAVEQLNNAMQAALNYKNSARDGRSF